MSSGGFRGIFPYLVSPLDAAAERCATLGVGGRAFFAHQMKVSV